MLFGFKNNTFLNSFQYISHASTYKSQLFIVKVREHMNINRNQHKYYTYEHHDCNMVMSNHSSSFKNSIIEDLGSTYADLEHDLI